MMNTIISKSDKKKFNKKFIVEQHQKSILKVLQKKNKLNFKSLNEKTDSKKRNDMLLTYILRKTSNWKGFHNPYTKNTVNYPVRSHYNPVYLPNGFVLARNDNIKTFKDICWYDIFKVDKDLKKTNKIDKLKIYNKNSTRPRSFVTRQNSSIKNPVVEDLRLVRMEDPTDKRIFLTGLDYMKSRFRTSLFEFKEGSLFHIVNWDSPYRIKVEKNWVVSALGNEFTIIYGVRKNCLEIYKWHMDEMVDDDQSQDSIKLYKKVSLNLPAEWKKFLNSDLLDVKFTRETIKLTTSFLWNNKLLLFLHNRKNDYYRHFVLVMDPETFEIKNYVKPHIFPNIPFRIFYVMQVFQHKENLIFMSGVGDEIAGYVSIPKNEFAKKYLKNEFAKKLEKKPIFFIHMHKCMGTSFVQLAKNNKLKMFEPNRNGNPWNQDSHIDFWDSNKKLEDFLIMSKAQNVQFFCAESNSPLVKDMKDFAIVTTILRDPLSRFLSHYNHELRMKLASPNVDIFYNDPKNHNKNFFCYMLSNGTLNFDLAVESLKLIDHVMIMENKKTFDFHLKKLGLTGEMPTKNQKSGNSLLISDLSESFKKKFIEENQMDYKLIQIAENIFSEIDSK